MKRIISLVFLGIFCLSTIIAQQSIDIRGTVVDAESNEPIPGVNVSVKGTTTGTITDIDGNYILSAPSDAILMFSFIGMTTQEVAVAGRQQIDISLRSDTKSIDEVVVVGYGTATKKDITGSVVGVKGDELAKQSQLSATQALQGKVAGLRVVDSGAPGEKPLVRVRGTGTILGGADPLYVVDGIITHDIRNINNADILSIDLLKDASSAAIYGVRGANGVIIITTKAGSKGKTKVSYDGYVGVNVQAKDVDMANSRLFKEYANEALVYDGKEPVYDESVNDPTTNWMDEITRVGMKQDHNISINGGGDAATYYFSAGYYKDEGILDKNNYERFTVRTNNTYQISSFLEVGNNIGISRYDADNVNKENFTNAYRQAPHIPVFNEDGTYGYSPNNNVANPRAAIDYSNDRSWGARVQGSAYADLSLGEHLSFRTSFGLDWENNKGRVYTPTYWVSPSQKVENSSLRRTTNEATRWVWDNILQYENKFDLHAIKVMAGTTAEEYHFDDLGAERLNVPASDNYWYLNLGDVATAKNNGTGRKETRKSFIGRVNYAYADKYLFTGTIRRDGSSKFPKGNRNVVFPAFGLGWRMSEEAFMQGISWLDNLKLRASWGQMGNDAISPNAFIYTISPGLDYVLASTQELVTGATIQDVKDPDLQWEVTTESNLGLEFNLLHNKLSGEFDYYHKKTTDALIEAPIDAIYGDPDGKFLTNKADILNKGFEVVLNWDDKLGADMSYHIGATISRNSNKIDNVRDGIPIVSGDLQNGQVVTRTEVGQPIGAFWIYETDGIFNTQEELDAYVNAEGNPIQPDARPGDLKIVDNNGDGKIDDDDRAYCGSYNPKLMLGLNLGFTYKNLDFSLDGYGNFGNKIYNGKKAQVWGGENIEASLAGRWTPENTSSNTPRASNNVPVASDYYLEDGNYFRINNITVGYTLPQQWLETIRIERCRVYFSARNAITWMSYSGYTPELPNGSLDSGIELGAYPQTASYFIGLNVNF
ncbi:TonB-dependent receptor [Marinilabiliaceae bacterium JC017]|nr:TonB-dependent receptor [Marinilabiliaceae bacterium JC017]